MKPQKEEQLIAFAFVMFSSLKERESFFDVIRRCMAGTYSSGYLDHQKYCPYVKLKFSPQLNQVRLVI